MWTVKIDGISMAWFAHRITGMQWGIVEVARLSDSVPHSLCVHHDATSVQYDADFINNTTVRGWHYHESRL